MFTFLFFVYLPELTTSVRKRLSPVFSIVIPTLQTYVYLLAGIIFTTFDILTYQPPHLALFLRLRVDEAHLEVLKHGIALMTWQPPRLRWLTRSWLPEWAQSINVPADDDPNETRENEMQAEVGKIGKQRTIAEAASLLEAEQQMRYTDPILAVLVFVPSHKDVGSLMRVFWRFHFAMLNTGRPWRLTDNVEKRVQRTVEKTVAGVAEVGWRAEGGVEGFVVRSVESGRGFGDLGEEEGVGDGEGEGDIEEVEWRQVRVDNACESCPGCYDGSGCVHRRSSPEQARRHETDYGYEYDDDSASDASSDFSTNFSSECGSNSTAPSSFSSTSSTPTANANHVCPTTPSTASTSASKASNSRAPSSKASSNRTPSTIRRKNSFGRLRSYNTRILPPPSTTTKPLWAQTPSERRRDPADFTDTYLRQTYRRRVGRDIKEGRGLEWHYSSQSTTSLSPSWESL